MEQEPQRIPDVRCVAETEKAIRIQTDDDEFFWVPKSQVTDDSDVRADGDEGDLVVTGWYFSKLQDDGAF